MIAWWSSTRASFTTRASGRTSRPATYSACGRSAGSARSLAAIGFSWGIWSCGRNCERVRGGERARGRHAEAAVRLALEGRQVVEQRRALLPLGPLRRENVRLGAGGRASRRLGALALRRPVG